MPGLTPARFNRLLRRMGQRVRWRRAAACPCRDPHSGQARPTCPVCEGRGVMWGQPRDAWTGLSSMKVAREWAEFGEFTSGDVILTIPSDSPLYGCGEHDRIVMADSSEPFSAILTRGENDRLTVPALRLERVFWLNDAGDAVVEGAIPSVAPDGTLGWASGGAPPEGRQYTVQGRRHQEYFVFKDLPQDRAHYGGRDLPRRVAARRFDLFGR